MIIQNGFVYGPDHQFLRRDLAVTGTRIVDSSEDDSRLDATNCYVIPGLIDVHIHGCSGCDFGDASEQSLHTIAKYEAANGVTSICPTSMTVPKPEIRACASILKDFSENPEDARILGMNMEGPFISPEKKGSQESTNILNPDAGFVKELLQCSGGKVKLVDFAPERPGALAFIHQLKDLVVLSIAHTNADYETALSAMKAGAHHVTHLYNAMSPYSHRAPGVVGAASDDPECMVELIADGFHNHPSVVRNTFRMFGPDRIVLISDSMRATGCPDGKYELGGHEVFVQGNQALLKDGSIAASVTNLMQCMRTCVIKMGIPLEDAVLSASETPAKSVGVFEKCGSLEPGKAADMVLLDQNSLQIRSVIVRGHKII